jgi:moderate conductance mechanosensitive channel
VDPELETACGPNPSWLCDSVFELTDGNRFLAETADWLVSVVIILLLAWIFAQVAKRYLGRMVARVVAPDKAMAARQLQRLGDRATAFVAEPIGITQDDPRRQARLQSISFVVASTAAVIIWSIAIIMALGELGVDLAPLIAGAGIAGVALGFGAQSLVRDCISGLFMLLEDQYGVGDVVDLDEATGVVEKVSLRTTVLRGLDGTVWHVPNGNVTRVGNKSQLWSVALVDVDVAYDSDLAAARRVILDCANEVVQSERLGGRGDRSPASARRGGTGCGRHHDQGDDQGRARCAMGVAASAARGVQGGALRRRHGDPLPAAHDLGAPRRRRRHRRRSDAG